MASDQMNDPADEHRDASAAEPDEASPTPHAAKRARDRLAILSGMTIGAAVVATASITCDPWTTSVSIN